ncbi:hypothetical protein Esti_004339 [Eimeria stiedai]
MEQHTCCRRFVASSSSSSGSSRRSARCMLLLLGVCTGEVLQRAEAEGQGTPIKPLSSSFVVPVQLIAKDNVLSLPAERVTALPLGNSHGAAGRGAKSKQANDSDLLEKREIRSLSVRRGYRHTSKRATHGSAFALASGFSLVVCFLLVLDAHAHTFLLPPRADTPVAAEHKQQQQEQQQRQQNSSSVLHSSSTTAAKANQQWQHISSSSRMEGPPRKGYVAVAEGPKFPAMVQCFLSVLLTLVAAAGTAARHVPMLRSCCRRRRPSASPAAAARGGENADLEQGGTSLRELRGPHCVPKGVRIQMHAETAAVRGLRVEGEGLAVADTSVEQDRCLFGE